MIFITHDLGVVAQVADTIAVMHQRQDRGIRPERGNLLGSSAFLHSAASLRPRTRCYPPCRSIPARLARRAKLRSLAAGNDRHDTVCQGADAGSPRSTRAGSCSTSRIYQGFRGPRSLAVRTARAKSRRGAECFVQRPWPAQTFGLVGESGSGKTTVGRCVARAIDPTSGTIAYRRDDGTVVDLAASRPARAASAAPGDPADPAGPVHLAQSAHDGARPHRRAAAHQQARKAAS